MCDPTRWDDLREQILYGWVKGPDGRLYHPTVAEKANNAWSLKQAQRQRTEAARLARAQKRHSGSDGSVTLSVTEDVGAQSQPLPSVPTGSKREGEGEGEYRASLSSLRDGPRAGSGEGEASSQKPSEVAAGPDPVTVAVASWDEICTPKLARVLKVTEPRRRAILARLRDDFSGDLDQWRAYLRRIAASPFLTGGGERGWKADLDWAVKPANVVQVLEGKYDPKGKQATASAPPGTVDDRYFSLPLPEVLKLPKPRGGTPERLAWDNAVYGRPTPHPSTPRHVPIA
jgi:hypothetical protein